MCDPDFTPAENTPNRFRYQVRDKHISYFILITKCTLSIEGLNSDCSNNLAKIYFSVSFVGDFNAFLICFHFFLYAEFPMLK